ncbi:hypothetical protein DYB31_012798 [Aphanomyces astaci]|uniref:Transmembrane protein n=1 Tax=Aphanomyces astaci TaxID=112090 RepID=A0A397EYK0_APHAT|nr:hypothetical protein DYB31_012798 [Aphanomyces astaci]
MPVKPTSIRALLAVNAGLVYASGLFVYMGSAALDSISRAVSAGTILPDSAVFIVVVGVLGMCSGVYGAYTTNHRSETHLSRVAKAMALVSLLFLTSFALSLVMYLQSTRWLRVYPYNSYSSFMPESRVAYETAFSGLVCPIALGFACHGQPMTVQMESSEGYNSVQSILMPSTPSGKWTQYSYKPHGWYGVNESVASALTMVPRNSGRFIDLCSNVTGRMEALGPAKTLAAELKRACRVCASVAPVNELPSWMDTYPRDYNKRHMDIYAFVSPAWTKKCMQRLDWGTILGGGYSGYSTTYNLYGSSSAPLSSAFLSKWSSFALAICVSSGFLGVVSSLLAFEAQRTVKELPPASRPN